MGLHIVQKTEQFQQWAWQAFLALLETDRAQPTPLYLAWPFPKDVLSSLYCDRQCGGSHAKPLQAQCTAPTPVRTKYVAVEPCRMMPCTTP